MLRESLGVQRFLRGHEDEERLAGKNMFDIKKLDDALNDAGYANTLFQRWKSHDFDDAKVLEKLKSMGISINEDAEWLLQSYRTYLNSHSLKGDPKLLFDRAKIDEALTNGKSTNALFGKWKSYGYESDDVFKKFQTMGVRTDDSLYNVYLKYLAWLNTHHPLKYTKPTTADEFLFDSTRIKNAISDSVFAEKLFAKWKGSGLDERPVYDKLWKMGLKNDDDLYQLYRSYVFWLDEHFPLPAKASTP
ncbi:hypothetical protein AM587_10003328 [Phytophthora nicotianae]|nr:hypothetical protein L916_04485 [Phytophthora nicotianae]ETM51771.1 hypothetical protein L914_04465 [Phytophthora nicotianae]KUF86382.1 Zinc (Zn2)-Iron (Fe2) Permease (ZIP) Family [Phytophthora nicotianae]KUF90252.1 hypothetical protein AM587_10003328 [Phytophthora nicotianae]